MSRRVVVLFLDDDAVVHIGEALRRYVDWTRRIGQRIPHDVVNVDSGFRSDAQRRQQPRLLDVPLEALDGCPMPPRLLTYKAVAHQLSLSRRQVDRLIATGDLPVTRIGGAARIRREHLDAFIDRTTDKETSC